MGLDVHCPYWDAEGGLDEGGVRNIENCGGVWQIVRRGILQHTRPVDGRSLTALTGEDMPQHSFICFRDVPGITYFGDRCPTMTSPGVADSIAVRTHNV